MIEASAKEWIGFRVTSAVSFQPDILRSRAKVYRIEARLYKRVIFDIDELN